MPGVDAWEVARAVFRRIRWSESVMPYGLMPSLDAIQQAVREPLSRAPREHKAFAVYIFERAREIDQERALSITLAKQEKSANEARVLR